MVSVETSVADRRVLLCRLAVWSGTLLLAFVFFQAKYPLARDVAAFGAAFSLLSALIPQGRSGARTRRATGLLTDDADMDEADGDGPADPDANDEPDTDDKESRLPRWVAVGMDLLTITVLINVSGGFASPFAPLTFVAILEAFALLGGAAAIYAALGAALLNLAHFRLGVSAQSAVVYGLAAGALLASAILVGLSQGAARRTTDEEDDIAREGRGGRDRGGRTRARLVETLEADLAASEQANQQLKSQYRDVAQRHREQKAQIDRLRLSEQFFEASVSAEIVEGDARWANARLTRLLMDALDAGGGVLWLRDGQSETLTVQAVEGRVAPGVRAAPITRALSLSASELRSRCEDLLLQNAPASAHSLPPKVRSGSVALVEGERGAGGTDAPVAFETDGNAPLAATAEIGTARPAAPVGGGSLAQPVVAIALREAGAETGAAGALLGVVGLCDPRGAARFSPADLELLQNLTAALSAAFSAIAQRRAGQRRVREVGLLYDLSRLVQGATDLEQVYQVIVTQALQIAPCENCTLFLLDRANNRLEAKATRGRVVNLLDHVAFEMGTGVSGWVAGKGRQMVVPDLTKAPNLLNVEMIPPRVRAFAAIPMRVQDAIVGVINLSDPEPNVFRAEDLALLTMLAEQAAVTIERTETFHTLETLAITDGLTQIYNHRYFQMRLEDELRRARRYGLPLSLLLADVDFFKAVNDRHGHASGDGVLRDLAALLKRTMRETEIVARYGGEEFAVVLPQTGAEAARGAAERLRAAVEDWAFAASDGQTLRLTISIGLATFPLAGETREALLTRADRALYAAKNAGRNRVVPASD